MRLSIDRIQRLTGRILTERELRELFSRVKGEPDLVDGYVELEVTSDRPDLMISEGVARAFRGLLDIERGLPRYNYYNEDIVLRVERVETRPYIAMAVVRGVDSGEDFLRELIQFQEKLHMGLGRGRRKMAIGIHDLKKIPGRECVYRLVSLDTEMTPLHVGRRTTVREVLRETEQGVLYGSIAVSGDRHPAIVCGEEIISLPPVINSDITRLDTETRDLLIDVTGTEPGVVERVLEIITTTVAEGSRDRAIGRVLIESGGSQSLYPRGDVSRLEIDVGYIESVLGLRIGLGEAVLCLERMRFGTRILGEGLLEVLVPPYRIDILHKIDVVEEVAMAYGLEKIGIEPVATTRRGRLARDTVLVRQLRDYMSGFGYTEVMSYILTPRDLYESLGLREYVEVANPVSREFSVVRPGLVPSMLLVLHALQNQPKPVRVYEIGEYVVRDGTSYTGYRTRRGIVIGLMDYETRFEEIHALVFSLLRLLGLEPRMSRDVYDDRWSSIASLMIEGRRGFIHARGQVIGVIGEVRPDILERIGLRYPVVVSEIDLQGLLEVSSTETR